VSERPGAGTVNRRPLLPEEVVAATSARYLDAFRRITGLPLDTAALP